MFVYIYIERDLWQEGLRDFINAPLPWEEFMEVKFVHRVYVYIYADAYIYIYIYIYICVCVCVCVYLYLFMAGRAAGLHQRSAAVGGVHGGEMRYIYAEAHLDLNLSIAMFVYI